MSDPYLGEIRMFAGNFAPLNWALCDGQLLQISMYDALYSLIGTAYGGDGQTTFATPDLRGRAPIHMSSAYQLGQLSGTETVTLLPNQLPVHTHTAMASTDAGTQPGPGGNFWAKVGATPFAANPTGSVGMSPQAIAMAGGSMPHENMMPFLTVNYIICLVGVYPSRG